MGAAMHNWCIFQFGSKLHLDRSVSTQTLWLLGSLVRGGGLRKGEEGRAELNLLGKGWDEVEPSACPLLPVLLLVAPNATIMRNTNI